MELLNECSAREVFPVRWSRIRASRAELLHSIRRPEPSHLVMDVWIHPCTDDPVRRLYVEDGAIESSSFPFASATGNPVVGVPADRHSIPCSPTPDSATSITSTG